MKKRLEADVGGSSLLHGGGQGTARGASGWDQAPTSNPGLPSLEGGGAELTAPPVMRLADGLLTQTRWERMAFFQGGNQDPASYSD